MATHLVFPHIDCNFRNIGFRTYQKGGYFRWRERFPTNWSLPTYVPDLASQIYCICRHHSRSPTRCMLRTVRRSETILRCALARRFSLGQDCLTGFVRVTDARHKVCRLVYINTMRIGRIAVLKLNSFRYQSTRKGRRVSRRLIRTI